MSLGPAGFRGSTALSDPGHRQQAGTLPGYRQTYEPSAALGQDITETWGIFTELHSKPFVPCRRLLAAPPHSQRHYPGNAEIICRKCWDYFTSPSEDP